MAVGTDGTNRVMYSADGITWTSATVTEANQWGTVTYGNGRFVAVANTGTNRVVFTGLPLSVTSTVPTANATNISTDANVALTFSADLDATTVTTSNIVVRGEQSGAIAGSWAVDGAVATFTPSANFTAGGIVTKKWTMIYATFRWFVLFFSCGDW